MNDWVIILGTLETLTLMEISAMHLSDDGKDALTALSNIISKMGNFTSCFSNDSINSFVESLIGMSNSNRKLSSGFDNSATPTSSNDDQENESFRQKFLTYAGQALYIGTGEQVAESTSEATRTSNQNSKNPFAQSFYSCMKNKLSKVTSNDNIQDIPYALLLLVDLIIENSFRFRILNQTVLSHVSGLAAFSSNKAIRSFAFEVMTYLVSQGLDTDGLKLTSTRQKISNKCIGLDGCLVVNGDLSPEIEVNNLSLYKLAQDDLLLPICYSITTTNHREAAEIGLLKLKGILELGLSVSGAWLRIIHSIIILSGGDVDNQIDRSTSDWSLCCTTAFGCLRLIVDDFLDSTDDKTSEIRTVLLDCCASFGRSQHDVNISLTATGMLWTIADQDDSPTSVEYVLAKLASLTDDDRVEVRNCSVNTLFSCIVGCGNRFSETQWQQCIIEIIFGVLKTAASHCDKEEENSGQEVSDDINQQSSSSRYKVSRHHTRDSTIKQWTTTKVLIIQGIERVLKIFFDRLIEILMKPHLSQNQEHWFNDAWQQIVQLAYACSVQDGGREILDLRMAGVDLLSLCCQVSSKAGVIAGDVRVGTNMQVVNGALRSVRVPNKNTVNADTYGKRIHNPEKELAQQIMFEYAFVVLINLNEFLVNDKRMKKRNESHPTSLDNTTLQVLTKLCQGLVYLYDCCKDHELSYTTNDKNEASFLALILTVTTLASAPGSKYLTQVQRICFELLEKMSDHLSLAAYKTIAKLFFW